MKLSNTIRSLYFQTDLNWFRSEFSHGNIDNANGLKKDNSKLNSMKKILLLIAVVAVIAGCSKKEVNNDAPFGITKGYEKFLNLKTGDEEGLIEPLYAGQDILVGEVSYNFEYDDNNDLTFIVTYDLTEFGWTMSESHVWAGAFEGEAERMPLNQPGNPQIGRFPYARDYDPGVSVDTYVINISDLPSYEEDGGFTAAAHCVVHGPDGQTETAWRWALNEFPGKRWGWYSTDFLDLTNSNNPTNYVFATEDSGDGTLNVYLVNTANGDATLLISDEVGYNDINFDATAYDNESGYFFFTGTTSNNLYGINMNEGDSELEVLGVIDPTHSADYYNDNYYYVDNNNDVIVVTFDDLWQVSALDIVGSVSDSYFITDIAINSNTMYMLGDVEGDATYLIGMDIIDGSVVSEISTTLNQYSQISYSSEGDLNVIEASIDGSGSVIGTISPTTGIVSYTDEDDVVVVDPFGDMATGPMIY
jgi:hypothetical protein